jgi:hypothetical protein
MSVASTMIPKSMAPSEMRLADHHHHGKGEQEREWNSQRDDERGLKVSQKKEQNDEDEDDPADQNIRDGFNCRMD